MRIFRRKPKRRPLRRGVWFMPMVGSGLLNRGERYVATIEVEEWERAGNLSRIRPISASGVDYPARRIFELVPKWVDSSLIRWIDEQATA